MLQSSPSCLLGSGLHLWGWRETIDNQCSPHTETSLWICRANQLTCFYVMEAFFNMFILLVLKNFFNEKCIFGRMIRLWEYFIDHISRSAFARIAKDILHFIKMIWVTTYLIKRSANHLIQSFIVAPLTFWIYGSRCSRIDQVQFVEDSL